MSIDIQELTKKIEGIDKDLEKLRTSTGDTKHLEILADYREYLKEELDILIKKGNNNA